MQRPSSRRFARVNERGFVTQERPGEWLNLSKYANPAPAIPPAGTPVRLTLDKAGLVRAVEPVVSGRSPADTVPTATLPLPLPEARESRRLALLAAAAVILAPRGEAKTADVVRVAEAWEGWVRAVRMKN